MIPKPLESIVLEDIQGLIDNQVGETKTIEYKRDIPGNSDGDKVSFLRAVSSIANTAGGDVLYGVEALDGIPKGLPGLDQ